MKYKDIVTKNHSELEQMIVDLRAELFTLRFKNRTGQLDQTHKIALVRRDIAKVLTALRKEQN